jgi:serine/threonine-protein kinase
MLPALGASDAPGVRMAAPFRIGRYESMRLIASGGMATVYLGRALGAGGFQRMMALKVMQPHLARDPHFVDMFLDEARLAARIRHPNVVATFDIEQEDGVLCLVMEYVEGASLLELQRAHRERAPRLPLPIALRIFLDMLAGLDAAHELVGADGMPLQLVHRDVSPHNVLVGKDGIARITDFGVARAEERIAATRGGQLKGKLAYMAPEQITGEGVDRRTDIYGAGCVLWEMLVGQRLFEADNDGALVISIADGPSSTPREEVPSLPEALSMACMRALAADKERRHPTAQAFAAELEQAAADAKVPIASARALGELTTALFPATDTLPPLGPAQPARRVSVAAPSTQPPRRRAPPRSGGGGAFLIGALTCVAVGVWVVMGGAQQLVDDVQRSWVPPPVPSAVAEPEPADAPSPMPAASPPPPSSGSPATTGASPSAAASVATPAASTAQPAASSAAAPTAKRPRPSKTTPTALAPTIPPSPTTFRPDDP